MQIALVASTDQNLRTPWSGLSSAPKLETLVTTAPGFSHVCSPEEREALSALVPAYEDALRPAPRHGVRRAIGKLALAFPSAKLNDDEAEARLELYADALADIPSDVLGEACMAVVRKSRFFPAVAEIRAECGGLFKRQWELSKIKALIATHDRNWRPAGEPMTDDDRRAFAKLAGRLA